MAPNPFNNGWRIQENEMGKFEVTRQEAEYADFHKAAGYHRKLAQEDRLDELLATFPEFIKSSYERHRSIAKIQYPRSFRC